MKLSELFAVAGFLQVASAATGPNWPGFKGIRYFFAFGDSYTTVGFNSRLPVPTDANPLGVNYPGSTTAGGPNWVGYLTTQYNQSRFLTFDYAVSGNQVSGVGNQINQDFLSAQGAGKKPTYAPWTAQNSLFATFIGINDLNAGAQIVSTINTLFNHQETLYSTGARNFVFVNVPPTNRCPFSNNNPTLAANVKSWNAQLKTSAEAFQAKHPDVAVFYYDSWSLYTKLLDNPSQYGFKDIKSSGGDFWIDTIHPWAKVHQYMATDLATFLANQGGQATTVPSTPSATRTTTAPASTATGTVPKYGQCGGQGYTGPTVCVSGTTCTFSNTWYSQCL